MLKLKYFFKYSFYIIAETIRHIVFIPINFLMVIPREWKALKHDILDDVDWLKQSYQKDVKNV